MLYKNELDYKIIRNTYPSSGISKLECLNNEIHFIETMTSPCKHYCFKDDDHSVQLADIDMKIISIFKMKNKIHFITEDAIYVYNRITDNYSKLVDVSMELPNLDAYTSSYSIESLVVGDEVYITCPLIVGNVWYTNIYKINPYRDNSWELFKSVNCYAYSDNLNKMHICTWLIYIWGNFYYMNSKNGHIYDIKEKQVLNNVRGSKFIMFHDKILVFGSDIKQNYLINNDLSYTTIDTNFKVQSSNPIVVNDDNIYIEIIRYYETSTSKLLVKMYQKECNALVSYFDMKKYIHIKQDTTDLIYDEDVTVPGHLEFDGNLLYMNPKLYCTSLSLFSEVTDNISMYNITNIKFIAVYNEILFIICKSKYYYQRLDGNINDNFTRVSLTSFDIPSDEVSDAFTVCGSKIFYGGRYKLCSLDMITLKTNIFILPHSNSYTSLSNVDNENLNIYFEYIEDDEIKNDMYTFNIEENRITRIRGTATVPDIGSRVIVSLNNGSNCLLLTKEKNNEIFLLSYIQQGTRLKYLKYFNTLLVLDVDKGIIYGVNPNDDPYIFMPLYSVFSSDDITVDLIFVDENNRKIYILKENKLYKGDIKIEW